VAIANFFDRALLSAAQVIRGVDADFIKARLESQLIEILFDDAAVSTSEGQAALDMTVRLVARLYPSIRLTPLGARAIEYASGMLSLAQSINPVIDAGAERPATARLILGDTAPEGSIAPTIFVGSDGWLARISTQGPLSFGSSQLPFAAGAAACIGAANLFRAIFSDLLVKAELDKNATLSLLDFTTGDAATQGPTDLNCDLGRVALVGVGAIGNAVVWALARTPGLAGTLDLVDHERVELSNLQRYVLTGQKDEGRQKVALARDIVEAQASSIAVEVFPVRWAQYVGQRNLLGIDRVVVALDSAKDRMGVQSSLPRSVLNAWTQVGDLGVSRHEFLGDKACLACLYLPTGQQPHEDQLIARALKMPEEPQQLLQPLRELLVTDRPVGEEFVTEAARRLGINPELLMPFAHEPLRAFYVKAVCGGIAIEAAAAPLIEAPLAFQSSLAGIMLAAELVATSASLREAPLPTKTTVDVTRPLGRRLSINVAKPPSDAAVRCICQDEVFIEVYNDKYGLARPKKPTNRKSRGKLTKTPAEIQESP
jgi:hypothetical protein